MYQKLTQNLTSSGLPVYMDSENPSRLPVFPPLCMCFHGHILAPRCQPFTVSPHQPGLAWDTARGVGHRQLAAPQTMRRPQKPPCRPPWPPIFQLTHTKNISRGFLEVGGTPHPRRVCVGGFGEGVSGPSATTPWFPELVGRFTSQLNGPFHPGSFSGI